MFDYLEKESSTEVLGLLMNWHELYNREVPDQG
jgi:hypothetical protein